MWTRLELKTKAKAVLKRAYWKALVVSFILSMVSGKGSNVFRWNINEADFAKGDWRGVLDPKLLTTLISIGIAVILIVIVTSIAFSVFLGYPLTVGARRFFISLTAQDAGIGSLGYAFKSGRYLNIVKTMFYRAVLVFLWTLLLIVPGIIKSYAYSMVPYILADNPQIDYKKAIDLSNKMTMGEKLNMWVLDLSFIGWYLLGALACGIGVIFVTPYDNATKAELYVTLRRKALQNGLFSYEELMSND
ncbi:MAG: hypothetical protein K0S71_782 [Clostridia bacterium]|jgi:uncharacterized membrane protein|nr:hypothetical protein [Clostridia bacterium]